MNAPDKQLNDQFGEIQQAAAWPAFDMALKYGSAAVMLSDKARKELLDTPPCPKGWYEYVWNSADCNCPIVCHLEYTEPFVGEYSGVMQLLAAYVHSANIVDLLDGKLVQRVEELALRDREI